MKSELKVRVEGGTVGGRRLGSYLDGKKIERISKAGSPRKNSMGFNTCSEERKPEIRIDCTVRNINRNPSMIVSTKKGIKGNGIITTSHFVLLQSMIALIEIGGKSIRRTITIISSVRFQR